MPLADEVIGWVVEVVLLGQDRITVCAGLRVSCEGWLKVEILHRLAEVLGGRDDTVFLPEDGNIDLTIRQGCERVLLELKTFPTNYGGVGKPITNFIDGVIEDLRKLSAKRSRADVGLAVWMAYPIPERVPSQWAAHVARIEAHATRTRRLERIPLWGTQYACLYVMESM